MSNTTAIRLPATTEERSWRGPGKACFLFIIDTYQSSLIVHFPLCTLCDCVCLFGVWVKEISGISWYHISIFSDIYSHVITLDVFTWSWSRRSECSCNICMQLIGCFLWKHKMNDEKVPLLEEKEDQDAEQSYYSCTVLHKTRVYCSADNEAVDQEPRETCKPTSGFSLKGTLLCVLSGVCLIAA